MKKYWWILAVLAVAVAAFMLYRKSSSTGEQTLTAEQYLQKVNADIDEDEKFNAIRNYADDYYAKLADDLEAAMKGAGTREDTVYSVFGQMKSNADCEALIEAFGKRKYSNSRGKLNLYSWISAELKRKEREKINTTLRNKHITYSFFD